MSRGVLGAFMTAVTIGLLGRWLPLFYLGWLPVAVIAVARLVVMA